MADRTVMYVVRATTRNLVGYSTSFDVVTGYTVAGATIYGAQRDVPAGRFVLALAIEERSGQPGGVVYQVNGQGNQMVAAETQPTPGGIVRASCTVADLDIQAGSAWIMLDDNTFRPVGMGLDQALRAQLSQLELRVPLPPPAPPAAPAEVSVAEPPVPTPLPVGGVDTGVVAPQTETDQAPGSPPQG